MFMKHWGASVVIMLHMAGHASEQESVFLVRQNHIDLVLSGLPFDIRALAMDFAVYTLTDILLFFLSPSSLLVVALMHRNGIGVDHIWREDVNQFFHAVF